MKYEDAIAILKIIPDPNIKKHKNEVLKGMQILSRYVLNTDPIIATNNTGGVGFLCVPCGKDDIHLVVSRMPDPDVQRLSELGWFVSEYFFGVMCFAHY